MKDQEDYNVVLSQILEIQKGAIKISDNGLNGKIKVHKNPVNDFTLNTLADYFKVTVKPKSEHNICSYIRIETDNCDIIVPLKTIL